MREIPSGRFTQSNLPTSFTSFMPSRRRRRRVSRLLKRSWILSTSDSSGRRKTMKNGVRNKKTRKAGRMRVEASSGNVFADLDIPNPEEALTKAQLAGQISILIAEQKLT